MSGLPGKTIDIRRDFLAKPSTSVGGSLERELIFLEKNKKDRQNLDAPLSRSEGALSESEAAPVRQIVTPERGIEKLEVTRRFDETVRATYRFLSGSVIAEALTDPNQSLTSWHRLFVASQVGTNRAVAKPLPGWFVRSRSWLELDHPAVWFL